MGIARAGVGESGTWWRRCASLPDGLEIWGVRSGAALIVVLFLEVVSEESVSEALARKGSKVFELPTNGGGVGPASAGRRGEAWRG